MPTDDLSRVRADLSAMRQAMNVDPSYSVGDVPPALATGLGGLLALPLLAFTEWPRLACIGLALLPAFVLIARRSIRVRTRRTERPAMWAEHRLSLLISVGFAVATTLFAYWGERFGTARQATTPALVFGLGAALIGVGLLVPGRRVWLACGVPVAAAGLLVPTLAPAELPFAVAAVTAAIGLLCGAVIWWETRTQPAGEGHDE